MQDWFNPSSKFMCNISNLTHFHRVRKLKKPGLRVTMYEHESLNMI